MSTSPVTRRRSLRLQEKHENKIEDNEFQNGEDEELIDELDQNEADLNIKKIYPSLNEELSSVKRTTKKQSKKDLKEKEKKPSPKEKKSTPKRKQKDEEKKDEETNWLRIAFWFLVAIAASYLLYFNFPGKTIHTNEWELFRQEFELIKNNFSKVIPESGFRRLNSQVRRILKDQDYSYPSLVLILGSEQQKHITKCLAKRYVEAISNSYRQKFIIIDGSSDGKNEIINKFNQSFEANNYHVILVENLEAIPTNDVMIFHRFTDHENAIYRRAIIVLTAYTPEKIVLQGNKRTEMDELASKMFNEKWKDLVEDQRAALLSRLTPSVVTVLYDGLNKNYCN